MQPRFPYRHPRPPAQGGPTTSSENLGIPDLRLLPTASLVLHEQADEKRVARLVSRVQADGYLKNPPIVAVIPGTDRYVVHDGANRTSAIQTIGCSHMLVQVVDYERQVQLYTWFHLISGRTPTNFLDEISRVEGLTLQPASIETAREALGTRQILAYIVTPTGDTADRPAVFMVDGTPGTDHHSPRGSAAILSAMVNTYKRDPQVAIHRVNSDELPDLMHYYDNVSGLVVFPPYTPADILDLAESGGKVPSGITRHIISHRA